MTEQSHSHTDATLQIQLLNKMHGIMHTQLIFVAAKLGIADLLEDGPKSIEQLAKATGTLESRLYRIMRTLASFGIFSEKESRYFSLTPLSELLRTEARNSLRSLAIYLGSEWHVRAWSNILHSVRLEESSFENIFGMNKFEYLQQHPDDLATFNNALNTISKKHAISVCDAYDFSSLRTIVDVGGGHGLLLSTILRAYPEAKGILFDMPEVTDAAHSIFQDERLNDRYQIIGGNFFTEIPKGGNAYILKNIIHDWDDTLAVKILKNCRDAMTPDSILLVVDAVITAGNTYTSKKLEDIEMMVMLNGRERTETEFNELFARAGFNLTRIIPTKSDVCIVEGFLK